MRARRVVVAAVLLAGGFVVAPSAAGIPAVAASGAQPASTGMANAATEDAARAAEYWLTDYGIEQAWQTTQGAGVKIAIIDTGIGAAPQLNAAVVGGADFSGEGSASGRTPVGSSDTGHGSWVASLAAARPLSDGTGMIGVAPQAQLLSASISFGSEVKVPFVTQVASAMKWAVDNGAKVINLSFTTNTLDWDPSWDTAFQYAFSHDVVVVVAAGNRGSGTTRVGAPATIPGVLTVAGVTPSGQASQEASTQGITIGVAAPSEQLLGVSPGGSLVRWNGTSGAAPIVAGIVALVRAAHPDLDAANVINRIIATATAPPGVSLGTVPNALYGYGLVNAAAAVSADVPTVTANPMGSLSDWITLHRRANASPAPEDSATPVALPALPPADAATPRGSLLLPSRDTLLYGSLPLLGVTVATILVALGVTAAVRRIRSARDSRTPSINSPRSSVHRD